LRLMLEARGHCVVSRRRVFREPREHRNMNADGRTSETYKARLLVLVPYWSSSSSLL
jgi:hypothetical protein